MLILIDSGCGRHHPRQLTLKGTAAAMVGRMVVNLPPNLEGYTYICEYGHTHCLKLKPREENLGSSPSGVEYAGSRVTTH